MCVVYMCVGCMYGVCMHVACVVCCVYCVLCVLYSCGLHVVCEMYVLCIQCGIQVCMCKCFIAISWHDQVLGTLSITAQVTCWGGMAGRRFEF